jgi:hydroxyethylthiazole kinase-like uncharacterized protein yjeF
MNPTRINTPELLARLKRAPNEHKGHGGKVLIIGGDAGMTGAVFLAGQAALFSGAGWVVLGVLDPDAPSLVVDHPELMIKKADLDLMTQVSPELIAIGPGLGQSQLAKQLLQISLEQQLPLVLDADALNLISIDKSLMEKLQKRSDGLTVLTPHPGEAARLLNMTSEEVQADRLGALARLVDLTHSIVVLKGQETLIGAPKQISKQCLKGNPGMGTGGMGDVLTGVLAAVIAQGLHHHLSVFEATCLSVDIHSGAADALVNQGVGPIGLTPSEIIHQIRDLINFK